jgi:hypothetical protein
MANIFFAEKKTACIWSIFSMCIILYSGRIHSYNILAYISCRPLLCTYIVTYSTFMHVSVHIQIQLLFSLCRIYAAVSNMRSYTVCSYNKKNASQYWQPSYKMQGKSLLNETSYCKKHKVSVPTCFFVAIVKT